MPHAAARGHATNPMDTARLLPWTGPDGKPCYLLGGTGTGYVSRLADRVEAEQMDAAAALIEEACRILTDRTWTPGELHLLAVELNTHLINVHRVSASRGDRLRRWEGDPEEDGDEIGGDGDEDRGGDGPVPGQDSPGRPCQEQGRRASPEGPRARLVAPVRPAGSVPGASLKGAAQGPPAR
ncbi:hypothetical protein MUU72_08110 [Streptomyces sp. RS10V-4]|uniref:hypothetical protein n=1 Tax=Streptomyces rhizoryzae TaxID=2932493 RepID=UPI002005D701|nr:hypothetical protein [Streptomyces rhizoryzae]MCK7623062.1 hypothetical protein [Streptomyces rhizoryzae]